MNATTLDSIITALIFTLVGVLLVYQTLYLLKVGKASMQMMKVSADAAKQAQAEGKDVNDAMKQAQTDNIERLYGKGILREGRKAILGPLGKKLQIVIWTLTIALVLLGLYRFLFVSPGAPLSTYLP